MAISRYDQPAQSQFISTYSPIPFNEMVQAGQTMQKQYETGMDALQRVYDDTYNIKYIPGSKDEQYVKGQVIPAAKEVFKKYIQMDMGDPMVRRQAIMDLNSKIDKQKINKIQESQAGWVDNQKWRQKLQAEGKYADYLDTQDEGYDTDVQGVYSKLTPAKMDYRAEAEQYFNNVRPDSRIVNGQVVGVIDDNKIKKTAKGNIQSFLDSTAGAQKLIEYRKRTGDYDTRPEDVAYNYLLEVGKEKLVREHQGFVPEYMTRSGEDTTKPKPVFNNAGNTQSLSNVDLLPIDKSTLSGLNIDKIKDISDIAKNFKLDSAGNIIANEDKYTYLDPYNDWKKSENPKKKREEEDKIITVKNTINNIRKTNPDLAKNTDIQILYAYSQARNNAKNVDYNTYLYDNSPASKDAKKLITDQIIDDMGGRLLLNASTGKSSGKSINTISDLFDDLDIPKEDRKKENLTITSIVPAKNAYKATIWASDGPHDFMISTNKREQSYLHLVEQATKAANNGVVGDKTINVNGEEYIVRTKLVNDGNNNFIFTSGIATKDPDKTIPGTNVRGVNLNDLESVSMSNLINNLSR